MNKTFAISVIALVAVIMGMSFGIVQATGPSVTEHIGAMVKLEQNGDDVDVEVKAQGLKSSTAFTVRAYSANDCGSFLALIGTANTLSDRQGNFKISGTVSSAVLADVESVSIRGSGGPGPIVVCFQDTNP